MTGSFPDESQPPVQYHELLERARRRDAQAFARLYDATYRRVFAYLLARLGAQTTAEDVLQEVYLAALRGLDRFRGKTEGEFQAWIFKIAHARVVDQLRSQYRRPEIHAGVLPVSDSLNPLDAIDQRLGLAEIARALSTLTEDQRNVVINRFVLGFDLEETSRLMRKNVGSVKALQHRALASLARVLRASGEHND